MALRTESPDTDAPVGVETPNADVPTAVQSPDTLVPGGRFRGQLSTAGETDHVHVALSAGQPYTFTLHGIGPDPVTDPVLRIYDATGTQLAVYDDVDVSTRQLYAHGVFIPPADGVYTLSAGAYAGVQRDQAIGHYELRIYEAIQAAGRTVTGTPGDDAYLAGGPGDDTLVGGGGDDVLDGAPGADTLSGGPGRDTAWYGYAGAGVVVNLTTGQTGGAAGGDVFTPGAHTQTEGSGRIRVLPDIENLHGSAYADSLTGNALPNTLNGAAGDDTLRGQGGNDWLVGGAGGDVLVGGAGVDAVSYADSPAGVVVNLSTGQGHGGDAAGDTFPGRKVVVVLDAAGRTQRAVAADIEYLDGSAYADTLSGDSGANRLAGRDGDDTLSGGEGDDWLEGEGGGDVLMGGAGQDAASYRTSPAGVMVRLHSGQAAGGDAQGDSFALTDTLTVPGPDGDMTVAVTDIEHLYGSAYDDILAGDGRNNVLDGGAGHDTLYGGPDGGDDTLNGGDGNDRIFGGKGDDTLNGGDGNDALRGNADDDTLNGGPGDDTLHGGPGNDRLNGGPGTDTLTGGDGADTFIFAPGAGSDTITDFERGQDRIDLSAFAELTTLADLTQTPDPQGLRLSVPGYPDDSLTLAGVSADLLTDADVIFAEDDTLIG